MSEQEVRSTRTRRAGGVKRVQVLDHVVGVLSERGYSATRFTDVSQVSGVAVSTLQGYFGSREDMLIEALEAATSGEVAAMAAMAARYEKPWQQVVALVDRGLSTPVGTWRMLMEFWTAAAHDAELCAHAAGLAAAYRTPFLEAIQRGVRAGDFAPRFEVAAIVDVVVAAMDGLLYPVVLDHRACGEVDYRDIVLAQAAFALGSTQ